MHRVSTRRMMQGSQCLKCNSYWESNVSHSVNKDIIHASSWQARQYSVSASIAFNVRGHVLNLHNSYIVDRYELPQGQIRLIVVIWLGSMPKVANHVPIASI